MSLFVIDPDRGAGEALCGRLRDLGFDTTHLADLADAAARIGNESPVLVLLCAGRQFDVALERLKQIVLQHPNVAVALVSDAPLDKTDVLAAIRRGAIDVFDCVAVAGLDSLIRDAIARVSTNRASATSAEQRARGAEVQLRELQRDQRAGRYIQMGMLPPSPMAVDDFRLCHRIFPSLMMSGDFVDYFRISHRHFAFYMADVSGHGASSAFVTVLLKNFSRRLRREFRPRMLKAPGEILAWLNRELLDNEIDKHVAMFVGVIDATTGQLAYANGGHFPSALLVDDDGCRVLELAGKPVGLFRDVSWESRQQHLCQRFVLTLVSDGVMEVIDKTRLADKEMELAAAVSRCYATGRPIWEELDLAAREPSPDDMACLMITRGLP